MTGPLGTCEAPSSMAPPLQVSAEGSKGWQKSPANSQSSKPSPNHPGNLHEQKEGAFQTIEAIIGVRSRATAISRANALLKFFRWRASATEDDGKPVTEGDAWEYLCHLRLSGAAATSASSFLSSCRYALHIFGFSDFETVWSSRRLKGLAELLLAGKTPIKQSKVLTVLQVLQLHAMLDDSSMNHVDRALVGYMIVALYSRCRHSDLSNVQSCWIMTTRRWLR